MLKVSKAEAEANANQEANAQAAAQRVEDPPTTSEKLKSRKKLRDDPRLSKYSMAGPSKQDAERAHRSGRLDMGADEGPSDSDISSEKKQQEGRLRAATWLWRKV